MGSASETRALSAEVRREVTAALKRWSRGSPQGADQLLSLVYDELRRLAGSYLRRQQIGHTLQPTALVHEAYLKLAPKLGTTWQDRTHFYAVMAKVMRGILVDHARAHATAKRGGSAVRVTLAAAGADPLGPTPDNADARATDILALDEALQRLASFDRRKARIVELRFFAGLTLEETAQILEVSVPTVVNEARRARAWLKREMSGGRAG